MSLIRKLLSRSRQEPAAEGPLFGPVRSAMADVRAYARSHGGDIELLAVSEEGDVTVRMAGACSGCPMSAITLKLGIEEQLRVLVPGVRRVIQAK
jgi:Fe-S cluster biogenesis protein NfuA